MTRRWFRGGSARITRHDAERLLDGEPTGHEGVAHLLAAAAAAPRPDELAGEHAAVAGFRREFGGRPSSDRAAAVGGPAGASATRPRRRRAVLVGVLSAAILAVGGTAYAASTGRLPDVVQRVVDDVFSGGSDGGGTPTASTGPGSPGAGGAGVSPSAPAAAPPGIGGIPGLDEARVTGLCRSWQATRDNPHSNAISAEDLRILAAAAGGEDRIAAFCAQVANPTPKPSKSDKPGNPDPGGGRPTAPPGGGRTKK